MEATQSPFTPKGMLIPDVDGPAPTLTDMQQSQLDDRRGLLDTALIGYQQRWDDGTIMADELQEIASLVDASRRGRDVTVTGVPVNPQYREALEALE